MHDIEELLEEVRVFADHDLPNFSDCVRSAFQSVDAVFARSRYTEFFFHCASTIPGWLPRVVMANADAESQGSEKLFSLWQGSSLNPEISKDVLIHAKDESRHSRVFVSLVDDAFPNSFPADGLQSKRAALFRITLELLNQKRVAQDTDYLMDHLAQMNMGEIRTRIHMLLLAPVIHAFAPADAKERVRNVLEGLVTDEIRHISYTARFLEAWCRSGDRARVTKLYARRLKDFHRVTIDQTEASVRAYGAGRYPDLLEI